jgi:hypothetical protein
LALAFAAGANGFSGDAGHDRRNKRRYDQTVELIFEPALSAFFSRPFGRPNPPSACVQVAVKGLDRARAVDQANVRIRSHQI